VGRVGVDCSEIADCDKTAVGFKVYGGYRYLSIGESKSEIFAYGGLGLAYRLTPQLAIAVEADVSPTRWCFDAECGSDNVQLYSIGLRYAF
jgi:hypothetical protein